MSLSGIDADLRCGSVTDPKGSGDILLQAEDSVVPAETQRIRKSGPYSAFAALSRNVVQITIRIGLIQIHGRWEKLLLDRQ